MKYGQHIDILVNPYPILPEHYTIPLREHQPQSIKSLFADMCHLLVDYPKLMVFYNGPRCGASAPDHAHLQAGSSGVLPLQSDWHIYNQQLEPLYSMEDSVDDDNISELKGYVVPCFVIKSHSVDSSKRLFNILYNAIGRRVRGEEPMMNIVAWQQEGTSIFVVIPRAKHRPDCYYAEKDSEKVLVSPGALDMSGLVITPRKEDFERLTASQVEAIIQECGITEKEAEAIADKINHHNDAALSFLKGTDTPEVTVGIVSAEKINFSLNGAYMAKGEVIDGDQTVSMSEGGIEWNGMQYRELLFVPKDDKSSFSLSDVTIGVNFHWERKETQTFQGALRLVVDADKICAINELPIEHYLESVISSEMKATSSLELLKAHAVISRSWLLAQMERRRKQESSDNVFFSFKRKEDELIRWYGRDDHTIFDVCADDHCQRYQGITRENSKHVVEAVKATAGQVLMYDNEICDARFSKCCGGVSEEYQYCWEDINKQYLSAIRDDKEQTLPDLTIEENAEKWIRSTPKAFCNTNDKKVLSQVLNDYDTETTDFYRWKVTYTAEELTRLVTDKLKVDLGTITDIIPQERGKSGRISRLKIVGTKGTFTIGKELEIRRVLSESHLYSSAFVVDKDGDKFTLVGAGWGHGVGLCQIGAAMMGDQGYTYDKILLHYYKDAEIKKLY